MCTRPLLFYLIIKRLFATPISQADKKKSPGHRKMSGTPKNGGDLLSQLVCQYHRRARA